MALGSDCGIFATGGLFMIRLDPIMYAPNPLCAVTELTRPLAPAYPLRTVCLDVWSNMSRKDILDPIRAGISLFFEIARFARRGNRPRDVGRTKLAVLGDAKAV